MKTKKLDDVREGGAFSYLLRSIIKEYKDGNNEPLDGDDVDKLIKHLRNKINFIEGNITYDEYERLKI